MAEALGVLFPESVDHDRRRAARRVDDDVREHHAGLNFHRRDLVGRDRILRVAEEARLVAGDPFGKDRDLHREKPIRGRQPRRADRFRVFAERPVEEIEDAGKKEKRDEGEENSRAQDAPAEAPGRFVLVLFGQGLEFRSGKKILDGSRIYAYLTSDGETMVFPANGRL